jgi:hypothetical protein
MQFISWICPNMGDQPGICKKVSIVRPINVGNCQDLSFIDECRSLASAWHQPGEERETKERVTSIFHGNKDSQALVTSMVVSGTMNSSWLERRCYDVVTSWKWKWMYKYSICYNFILTDVWRFHLLLHPVTHNTAMTDHSTLRLGAYSPCRVEGVASCSSCSFTQRMPGDWLCW